MDPEIKEAFDEVRADLQTIETRVQEVDRRVQEVDSRVQEVDRRVDQVDRRLSGEIQRVETTLRREIREEGSVTRRHFDVVAESLRDDIRLIAEGLIALDAKVDGMRRA